PAPPTLVVIGEERGVVVELRDPPHAVLVDVVVLVDSLAPFALAAASQHDIAAPARLRRAVVGRHIDDRLKHRIIVELTVLEPARAHQLEGAANVASSRVDAALPEFIRRIVAEERRGAIPEALVDVVAVGRLQPLDGLMRLEPRECPSGSGERRPLARRIGITARLELSRETIRRSTRGPQLARLAQGAPQSGRAAGAHRVVVKRRREPIWEWRIHDSRRTVGRKGASDRGFPVVAGRRELCPSTFVRGEEAGVIVKARDLPDTVLLDVVVLVNARAPLGIVMVVTEDRDLAPASLRGAPVSSDIDDGLQLHAVIDLAIGQAGARVAAALADQPLADSRASDVDAIDAHFHRRVIGEERGRFAPVALVEIVAVGALEL